jgi:hypothetical protein
MTPIAGTTKSGALYIMKYMDSFENNCTRNVEHRAVISQFFSDSNTINSHNQARKANLALEKKWLAKSPRFRLTTTLIGMNVTDTWKLVSFHGIINSNKSDQDKMMAITRFAGIVWHQLIHSAASLSQSSFSQPAAVLLSSCPTNVSSLSATDLPDDVLPICSLADTNGLVHLMVKLPLKQDRSGRK